MAPEVIVGRGYGKSADLWSLGVLIYEFLCGKVPFGHLESNPYAIYERILSDELEFPTDIPQLTEPAIQVMNNLLNKFSNTRQSDTAEKIKCYEWFNTIDWEDLYCKNILPPYKPTIKDELENYENILNEEDSWDDIIKNDSEDSDYSDDDESCDTEIEEYKKTIPHNWDQQFG